LTLSAADAVTGRTLRLPVTADAPCPGCTGKQAGPSCPDCKGSGRVRLAESKRIRIPAGVSDGQTLRLPGLGDTGGSGEAGDLYLTVRVQGQGDQPSQVPAPDPSVPEELKAWLVAELASGPMHIRDLRAAVPDVRGSTVTVALRAMEGHQVARVSVGVWRLASG
jgi:hypothetical protein